MYAARIMWGASYATAGLRSASTGSTSVRLPSLATLKPPGVFIQALTATTERAPPSPDNTTGTPVQKCTHGFRRFQPKM